MTREELLTLLSEKSSAVKEKSKSVVVAAIPATRHLLGKIWKYLLFGAITAIIAFALNGWINGCISDFRNQKHITEPVNIKPIDLSSDQDWLTCVANRTQKEVLDLCDQQFGGSQ